MAVATSTTIMMGYSHANQSTLHGKRHTECLFKPSPMIRNLSIKPTYIRCESTSHEQHSSICQKPSSYSSSSSSASYLETISSQPQERHGLEDKTVCGDDNNNGDDHNNNNNNNNNPLSSSQLLLEKHNHSSNNSITNPNTNYQLFPSSTINANTLAELQLGGRINIPSNHLNIATNNYHTSSSGLIDLAGINYGGGTGGATHANHSTQL